MLKSHPFLHVWVGRTNFALQPTEEGRQAGKFEHHAVLLELVAHLMHGVLLSQPLECFTHRLRQSTHARPLEKLTHATLREVAALEELERRLSLRHLVNERLFDSPRQIHRLEPLPKGPHGVVVARHSGAVDAAAVLRTLVSRGRLWRGRTYRHTSEHTSGRRPWRRHLAHRSHSCRLIEGFKPALHRNVVVLHARNGSSESKF